MGETSPRRTPPWVAFLAGVVATLAVVLAWWALSLGRRAGEVKISAPAPALGDLPRPTPPDAPRLPDGPIPKPR